MTKKEFSSKILRCSYHHWRYVLKGERNLAIHKAKLVSQLLNTDVIVWIETGRSLDRQSAWQRFINS